MIRRYRLGPDFLGAGTGERIERQDMATIERGGHRETGNEKIHDAIGSDCGPGVGNRWVSSLLAVRGP